MAWAEDFSARLARSRLSLTEVARLARLDAGHVWRLANGQRRPRRDTRRRIDQVFKAEFYRLKNICFRGPIGNANVKGDAERLDMIRGLYKSAAGLLCQRDNLDIKRLLSVDINRLTNERGLLKARREAIYLVSVGNNITAAEIGRALGLSRSAVSRMVSQVENSRNDSGAEDSLSHYETLVGGLQL